MNHLEQFQTLGRVGVITIGLAAALAASASFAANVHFKGGKTGGPAFVDQGLSLAASGALAGLGNEDLTITLEATGLPEATCTNPSGKNQPPGQNPAPVDVSGVESIPANEIKNGNVTFWVETLAPPRFIAGAPDCPNAKWTEEIVDIAFSDAVLTVEQGGAVVLVADCSFDPPTSDGAVSASGVDCVIR